MSKPNEERDIYYIPPNFLASGRLFGGTMEEVKGDDSLEEVFLELEGESC